MDAEFEKFQSQGRNCVEELIHWLKDAKVVDGKEITEDQVRKMFADVADAANVELSKFKEMLTKLATDHQRSEEEFAKSLADEAPKILSALAAGACAVSQALQEKK